MVGATAQQKVEGAIIIMEYGTAKEGAEVMPMEEGMAVAVAAARRRTTPAKCAQDAEQQLETSECPEPACQGARNLL